jgi:protein subunit release factor A
MADGGLTEAGELLTRRPTTRHRDSQQDVGRLEGDIARLEFQRMFPGEMDSHNCFLDIQAGAGGTEAQDWAEMLLRMYLRWADKHGFRTEVTDIGEGVYHYEPKRHGLSRHHKADARRDLARAALGQISSIRPR